MKSAAFLPFLILLALLSGSACAAQIATPSRPAKTLAVVAAASLAEPFNEIGHLFEAQNPNVRVVFNFAGSQQLARQLDQGAPADVFASASQKYMDAAVNADRVITGTQQIFAYNRLVVIFPKDNPAGIQAIQDLAGPGLKLALAAKEVPAGQYSLDFLEKAAAASTLGAAFKADVLNNVVSYEDNVKAVLVKVSLGEADAGIVYLSDISPQAAGKLGRLDIPAALNVIAAYPIAPLQNSQQPELAQAFIHMVLSPEGQAVLAKHNFIPAGQNPAP